MLKLKQLNVPLLRVCTVSKPYFLVSSTYNVSDKPYIMYQYCKAAI